MAERKPVIGIMDHDDGIIFVMEEQLKMYDYPIAPINLRLIEARVDYTRYIEENDPKAILVDVPPDRTYNYFPGYQYVRQLMGYRESLGRGFVITTTGFKQVSSFLSDPPDATVLAKPYNLEELINSVETALLHPLERRTGSPRRRNPPPINPGF